MAYDLEEQEQLDELKSWWKQYGTLVITVVATVAVIVAGYQGWNRYQEGRSVAASTLFEQLERAESAGDNKKVRDIAGRIVSDYGSTPYGTFAALSSARASFDTGDLAAAKTQLNWVISNAREDEIRDMARLRLASVLLDEKNYAEALKQLDAKPVEPLAALFSDLKGDVLAEQGNKAEARNAYQLALDRSEPDSPYRSIVQLKLDALGSVNK